MDFSAPFKNEVFRPIATLLLPGSVALAPYASVLLSVHTGVSGFLESNPGGFYFCFLLLALALGFLLEDAGSRIEALAWDWLIEKETGCHDRDWVSFLKSTPVNGAEPVGHRYLRTLTLRLKFELSIGLALLVGGVGVIWFDALVAHWSHKTLVCVVGTIAIGASYALWESYDTSWVLASVRHILATGRNLKLPKRTEDPEGLARAFKLTLHITAGVALFLGIGLFASAYVRQASLGSGSGVTAGCLLLFFAFVQEATMHWVKTSSAAKSRRRGLSLRLSAAYVLFAAFLVVRSLLTTGSFRWGLITYSVVLSLWLGAIALLLYNPKEVEQKDDEHPEFTNEINV